MAHKKNKEVTRMKGTMAPAGIRRAESLALGLLTVCVKIVLLDLDSRECKRSSVESK
jgi:hypothetical protein